MSNMLDALRASLPKNLVNFDDYIASALTDRDVAALFRLLIYQLACIQVADDLFLPDSARNFSEKLYEFAAVWSWQENFPKGLRRYCSSLLQKVASNAPDLDV